MNRSQPKVKRKKISPVDIVIAAIFLIALVSMIYLLVALFTDNGGADAKDGVAADCRLRIENVDTERFGITVNEVTGGVECAFLKTGDEVYDPQSGESIGRITAVSYEKTTAPTGEVDEEGNLIYAECPGYVDLILTFRTELESEERYTVGELDLKLGQSIPLRTASYEAIALVEDLETGVN